eukprot:TRINITY_DN21574_c0_g1_i1.p1 TRINITY_DN21574_c0_g1~~TRINITY_DN21574_c0_g1_i1.p1  ORF type:complete len:442 (+),score=70.55 TRINITY_DN21574_c0_g1_i1:22-1326(+)
MSSPSDNTFVTNLPPGLSDADVKRIFSAYGTVMSVRITSRPEHNFTSALIRYASVAEAQTIVESLNGNIPHTLTTPVECRFANAPGGKGAGGGGCGGGGGGDTSGGGGYSAMNGGGFSGSRSSPYQMQSRMGPGGGGEPSDNVFATSLPSGLEENDVKKIFGAYGTVLSAKIVSKPEMSFTSALIRFASSDEALKIVESLNGNIPHLLTAPIEVRFANSRQGGNKGKGADSNGAAGYGGGGPYGVSVGGAYSGGFDGGYGGCGGGSGFDGGYGDGGGFNSMMMKGCKGKGKGKDGEQVTADQMVRTLEQSGVLPGSGMDRSQVIEVFVFGLPPDTKDEHLYRMFSPFGQISPKGCAATFAKDTGLCKGFGFINFLSMESAQLAIQVLHGAQIGPSHSLRVELKKPGKNSGGDASGGGAAAGTDYSSMANILGVP